jgi:hypothetical protein
MVSHPGAPARADQLRPLNLPRSLDVLTRNNRPIALLDRSGRRQAIVEILDTWHVDDEWWREPVRRHYFQVLMGDGSLRTLYHDLTRDTWHEQRY